MRKGDISVFFMKASRFQQARDGLEFLRPLQAVLGQCVVRVNQQGDLKFLLGQLSVSLIQGHAAFSEQLI